MSQFSAIFWGEAGGVHVRYTSGSTGTPKGRDLGDDICFKVDVVSNHHKERGSGFPLRLGWGRVPTNRRFAETCNFEGLDRPIL